MDTGVCGGIQKTAIFSGLTRDGFLNFEDLLGWVQKRFGVRKKCFSQQRKQVISVFENKVF